MLPNIHDRGEFSMAATHVNSKCQSLKIIIFGGINQILAMKKNYFLAFAFLFISTILSAQNPDAAVLEVPMDELYPTTGQHDVKIKFQNAGTTNFSGVTLNWSTDGGTTVNSFPLPGFTFRPNVPFTITHNIKVTFTNPGAYTDLKVWTSNPGGMTDANTANDTLTKQIFVNAGISAVKRVMVEEFTTAPCGFCPDGALVLNNILTSNPNVIGLGIHAGFGTDAMTIPAHSTLASAFANGAPTAAIDRIKFSNQSSVAVSRSVWGSLVTLRQGLNTPLDVKIFGTYDSTTRTATVKVDADFVDYALPGDVRLGFYVVEDNVNTRGQGYNQTNYYHTGAYGTGHPYYAAGNPIVGYNHRHVVRDVFPSNDPWGDATVIPTAPQKDSSYSKTFTVPISSNWDANEIYFVAFATYHSTNVNEREIINAGEVKMNQITTSNIAIEKELDFAFYPNPAQDMLNLEINTWSTADLSRAVIRDLSGKILYNENILSNVSQIDLSAYAKGIYFLSIENPKNAITKKLIIK